MVTTETPTFRHGSDTERPGAERFAERRRRLAALRGRLLAAAVVVTLVVWTAMFLGLIAEHVELVGHAASL